MADIRAVVREELRPLQSIAHPTRRPSAAATNAAEILSVGPVAETVKVAATTVRMWIHSGQLRAIRPGVGQRAGDARSGFRGRISISSSRPFKNA